VAQTVDLKTRRVIAGLTVADADAGMSGSWGRAA
jgi:hypothetical protein